MGIRGVVMATAVTVAVVVVVTVMLVVVMVVIVVVVTVMCGLVRVTAEYLMLATSVYIYMHFCDSVITPDPVANPSFPPSNGQH